MSKFIRFIYLWGPVTVWAGLIFFLSSLSTLPSAQEVWSDFLFKKAAHITEYAIFYFLIVRGLQQKTKRNFLIAFLIAFVYASSDEIHQFFTPDRHPHPMDVGFDTIGMFISYLGIKTVSKHSKKQITS